MSLAAGEGAGAGEVMIDSGRPAGRVVARHLLAFCAWPGGELDGADRVS